VIMEVVNNLPGDLFICFFSNFTPC
jgi:hypothetical protein